MALLPRGPAYSRAVGRETARPTTTDRSRLIIRLAGNVVTRLTCNVLLDLSVFVTQVATYHLVVVRECSKYWYSIPLVSSCYVVRTVGNR